MKCSRKFIFVVVMGAVSFLTGFVTAPFFKEHRIKELRQRYDHFYFTSYSGERARLKGNHETNIIVARLSGKTEGRIRELKEAEGDSEEGLEILRMMENKGILAYYESLEGSGSQGYLSLGLHGEVKLDQDFTIMRKAESDNQ
jgi:hypothetical protein